MRTWTVTEFNQVLPAYGLQEVPAEHPWRKAWKRTFLSCEKPGISTLR